MSLSQFSLWKDFIKYYLRKSIGFFCSFIICRKEHSLTWEKKSFTVLWQKNISPLSRIAAVLLGLNDLREKRWQANARQATEQSSFVSTFLSIRFHQLTCQMASPACVTQKTISVLSEPSCADKMRQWEKEKEEKKADRCIFFYRGFLSISGCLSKLDATSSCKASWRVFR